MTAIERDGDKFVCRMPSGMRPWLKRRAQDNRRSMNAELVHLLEQVQRLEDPIRPSAGQEVVGQQA